MAYKNVVGHAVLPGGLSMLVEQEDICVVTKKKIEMVRAYREKNREGVGERMSGCAEPAG